MAFPSGTAILVLVLFPRLALSEQLRPASLPGSSSAYRVSPCHPSGDHDTDEEGQIIYSIPTPAAEPFTIFESAIGSSGINPLIISSACSYRWHADNLADRRQHAHTDGILLLPRPVPGATEVAPLFPTSGLHFPTAALLRHINGGGLWRGSGQVPRRLRAGFCLFVSCQGSTGRRIYNAHAQG